MRSNKKTSPRPFIKATTETGAHADGVAKSIKEASSAFAAVIGATPGDSKQIIESTALLSQNVGSLTKYLQDCLNDLASMGEAMTPVMESAPESASALMVNMMSTFLRQLEAYYRDVHDTLRQTNDAFQKGKAVLLNEPAQPSRLPSPRPSQQYSSTQALQSAGQPLTSPSTVADNGADATDPGKPARKKKKKRVGTTEEDAATDAEATSASSSKTAHHHQHLSTDVGPVGADDVPSHADPEMSALAAAAAAGADRKRKKVAASSEAAMPVADPVSSSRYAASTAAGAVPGVNGEPAYLSVGASVDDSMGQLILASRPGAFSRVDALRRRPVLGSYFVRLVQPGSLAYLVATTCVKGDEDIEADLFCDVLETEEVELVPFGSTSGEVELDSASDLTGLPACAWRLTNSEDHRSFFYTMYLMTTDSATAQKVLYLQDCVVMRGEQEEVLHSITVLDKTPQYAQVNVYSLSSSRNSSLTNKAASIMSFMRSALSKAGFTTVTEAEVNGAAPALRSKNRTTDDIRHRTESSAAAEFNPNVQLASLDQPAPGGANFNIGNVASSVMQGALRGGKEVLKAPFSVGKAVLDVTGVSGALRTTMENTFRRTFPELEGEEIIDCYAAALQDGGFLRQGYLYIATQYLCFVSNVSSAKFALEYDEIKDVQKSKAAKVFDNAIAVTTHLGTQYFIGNLLQRDQTYATLMEQWVK